MLVYFRFMLHDSLQSNTHFVNAVIEHEISFLNVCHSTRSFKKQHLFTEQLFW